MGDQEGGGQPAPAEDGAGGGEHVPVQGVPHYRPNARPPGPVDISDDDKRTNWELHKQMWENYAIASRLEYEPERIRRAEFLNSLGRDTLRIYNGLGGAPGDTVQIIIEKLDSYCIGKTNEAVAHFLFSTRDQKTEETVDRWLSDLRIKQKAISWTHTTMTPDELALRNRIICGVIDKDAQQKMLDEGNPDLNRVIDIAKASEATRQYMKTISTPAEVHKVTYRRDRKGKKPDKPRQVRTSSRWSNSTHEVKKDKRCVYCNGKHIMKKEECPAFGKKCNSCHRKNHFSGSKKCPRVNKIHALGEQDESSDESSTEEYSDSYSSDEELVNKVDGMDKSSTKPVYCEMLISRGSSCTYSKAVKFQIDCGATVNVIHKSLIPTSTEISPTKVTLSMWNGSSVSPVGECTLKLKNPKTKKKHYVKFIVVTEKLTPLLSRQAAEKMKLITINYEQFKMVNAVSDDMLAKHSRVFDGELGKMPGKVHLEVDEGVSPTICPPRRVPVAIKGKVKEKLKEMEDRGIIEKVEEPSDWVSQMAITLKKNGDIRVCIDPRPLNKALKREHYPMPVLDDILPNLAKARVFSKLDLKDGYWHCELDEESSKLTTFQTHVGRYRWKRLPFGISASAEIFQKRLKTTLEGLNATECIVDDILVWGTGESLQEAYLDHDKNLEELMKRAEVQGLKFNSSKCEFKTTSTVFQGHIVTSEGLGTDPEKVKAIQELEPPKNVEAVRVLRGTVNYLARFMPQLSTVMEPINRLTKDSVPWHWEHEQNQALAKIKEMITNAPVIAYYDPQKELVLQCDASEKGLGATILQEGRPVAYASRALTDTETRYAQIEKEAIAVAWSLEHFRQYTYGRKTVVHTDHKPLEPIAKKPLDKAPRRLQGILMKITEYDIDLQWKPGKEMHVADMLSRSYLPRSSGMSDIEQICMVDYLPVGKERLQQLKQETEQDETLQILSSTINKGWPEEKNQCLTQITPYFSIRDELSVQDGLIFRGERVVIPHSMRGSMKKAIHTSHLGVESCLRRAREALFWPGMNAEVKTFISECDTCRTYEKAQCKETLMPHEIPGRPWEKVGIDLFTWEDKNYLVTVDYFSNFWEVDRLKKTTSSTIIGKLKNHFARHGIPEQVISDNAQNLTSDEFQTFSKDWDFEHLTSSPYNSKANGKVELAVKAAKGMLRKARKSGADPILALLEIRNTPSQGIGSSPMQRLNNRRARTLLPMTAKLLQPRTVHIEAEREKLKEQKNRSRKYYNQKAKDLLVLDEGETVRMQPFIKGQKEWKKGVVVKRLDERSYMVDTPEGAYRRNRVHLRHTKEVPPSVQTKRRVSHIPPQTTGGDKTSVQKHTCSSQSHKEVRHNQEKLVVQPESNQPAQSCSIPAETNNYTTRSGRVSKKPSYLNNYVE